MVNVYKYFLLFLIFGCSSFAYAKDFEAPVLLVHGDDDTVVSIKQSHRMENALRAAGKTVQFVTLEDEDHWLSTSSARLKMLTSINEFLQEHSPSDAM